MTSSLSPSTKHIRIKFVFNKFFSLSLVFNIVFNPVFKEEGLGEDVWVAGLATAVAP